MNNIRAYKLSVFPYSLDVPGSGGNPTTIFLSADGLSMEQMQSLAQKSGHECGFVLTETLGGDSRCPLAMRYWVPNHEMEMCGHATVGAIWLLDQLGELPAADKLLVSTRSGTVEAQVIHQEDGSSSVLVSQPAGSVDDLPHDCVLEIVSSLGITTDELAPTYKVQNGRTSRTKTLVPLKSRAILNGLRPNFDSVRDVCKSIGSTGLYPYAVLNVEDKLVEARQFPKSSGYTEDPATGIAAAALAFSLQTNGILTPELSKPIRVWQGWAMDKPSEISVFPRQHDGRTEGCWISGKVKWLTSDSELEI